MNRELTLRERILLMIFIVLVMTLGYFKIIFEPVNDQIAQYRSETAQEQTELETALVRAAQMQKMQQAVDELKTDGEAKAIPPYDNSTRLMLELHRILEAANDYSLDFSAGTTQEGYIVRRPIGLTFRTTNYEGARAVIDALDNSENINQISDLSIRMEQGVGSRSVQTSLTITYFEVAS